MREISRQEADNWFSLQSYQVRQRLNDTVNDIAAANKLRMRSDIQLEEIRKVMANDPKIVFTNMVREAMAGLEDTLLNYDKRDAIHRIADMQRDKELLQEAIDSQLRRPETTNLQIQDAIAGGARK